jgi:CBS domain-containing protein
VNVKDAMSTRIMLIKPDATVAQARTRMVENNIRRLVVERAGDTEDYGVVTVRDVVFKVVAEGLDPQTATVGQIMNKPLFAVDPTMDLKSAAAFLKKKNVAGAAVMEDGKLAGIVTLWDILVKLGIACECKK